MSEFGNPNSPIKLNWVTIYNFTPEEVSDVFSLLPAVVSRLLAALTDCTLLGGDFGFNSLSRGDLAKR